MTARIGLIVEGPGDVDSAPIIVREHLHRQGCFEIDVPRAKTSNGRGNLTVEEGLERFASLAVNDPLAVGGIVLCDRDKDKVCELGPSLTERCSGLYLRAPVIVNVAAKKFENWILASGETTLDMDVAAINAIRDFENAPADTYIRNHFGRKYIKPLHQPKLAARIDHELAASRSPSFVRFQRCIDEIREIVLA